MLQRLRGNGRREGGAALVEFAILAPLLVLLLFGIIEFGWVFGKYNEVRHAVRETARYAAVSNPDRNGDAVIDEDDVIWVCDNALNLPATPTGTVDVVLVSGTGDVGDVARVTVTVDTPSLTNAPFISIFLPAQLTNTAEFRIEQPILWSAPISNGVCK